MKSVTAIGGTAYSVVVSQVGDERINRCSSAGMLLQLKRQTPDNTSLSQDLLAFSRIRLSAGLNVGSLQLVTVVFSRLLG